MNYKYLPTTKNNCKETIISDKDREIKGFYPCSCCGYITLPVAREEAIGYICPVCFWENDVFIKSG
ncbi:MAG: CPCC family cysteine-rich protein [Eubacteriales bacterium]